MKVAITGNIGSGKTEVLNIIKRKGYACYSADEINRELQKDYILQEKIIELLELEAFSTKEIAKLIFHDTDRKSVV